MSRIIVLDSGPLGLLANPRLTPLTQRAGIWFNRLQAGGDEIIIPEIADYEVRRDLIRIEAAPSLIRLDELHNQATYAALTTAAMRKAADLWARVRQQGRITADPHVLDGDVILAAQASFLGDPATPVIIATTNVKHLILFADARLWQDIEPL